jgi:hypothetical protein
MPTPQSPGTNQFRCDACGRHFNTEDELNRHRRECAAAQQSGRSDRPIAETPLEETEDRDWRSVP